MPYQYELFMISNVSISEDTILSFNIANYSNINAYSEAEQASVTKGTKSHKPSFAGVLQKYTPNSRATVADQIRAHSEEKRIMLNQLHERMRSESEARRMELFPPLISGCLSNIINALLPFRYPINCDTASLGGIFRHMWI
jgi:hypothetical protein